MHISEINERDKDVSLLPAFLCSLNELQEMTRIDKWLKQFEYVPGKIYQL